MCIARPSPKIFLMHLPSNPKKLFGFLKTCFKTSKKNKNSFPAEDDVR